MATQLQLLLFSGLAFFVMLPFLERTLTITLDLDWFYRVAPALTAAGERIATGYSARCVAHSAETGAGIARTLFDQSEPGPLARTWPTGSTALWVMVMLLAYLLLYYL